MMQDLLFAILLGGLGGLALAFLQEKGLELPHWTTDAGVTFANFGFIADIVVGLFAAAITYALNPPAEPLKLIASSLIAGVGGSAVLKSYINGKIATQETARADTNAGALQTASDLAAPAAEAAAVAAPAPSTLTTHLARAIQTDQTLRQRAIRLR